MLINENELRMNYLYSFAHKIGRDDYYGALDISSRLLETINVLNAREYFGLQTAFSNDYTASTYIYANEDSIKTEDYNWLFKDFARVVEDDSTIFNDSLFREDRVCYELIKKDDSNEDILGWKGSSLHGPFFQELWEELSEAGAYFRIILPAPDSEHGYIGRIVLSLPEEVSVRLRSLMALEFSGTLLKEESAVSDEERMSYLHLQRSMIRFLGFLTYNYSSPVKETDDEYDIDIFEHDFCDDYIDNYIDEDQETRQTPIEELDLSVRAYNCLMRAGIKTVEKLKKTDDAALMRVRNLGRKCYEEVKQKLQEFGEKEGEVSQEEKVDYVAMLEELIGLSAAKEQVKQIIAFARMQEEMKTQGKDPILIGLNMEFTGNPGTAKTTVARIMAGILKDIGIISGGELIEVGRSELVGEYVGHIAVKVRNLFERAKGRVLFIDEAYSLVDDKKGLFGDEAINTIVQEMENRRSETIVIFAGYPDEMKEFFDRNPGLRFRVPFTIHFEDYSEDELSRICELEASKKGFSIDFDAKARIEEICAAASGNPSLGNGRFCRNLIEKAILKYASRVFNDDRKSDVIEYALAAEDIETFNETKDEKAITIGFRP